MRTNCDVTVFCFDEGTGEFKKLYFSEAYVSGRSAITKRGIKQKGFYKADRCTVRIPTDENINARPGDYLHIGMADKDTPDRANDLKISEVCDNRIGSSPHFKLSCGGML